MHHYKTLIIILILSTPLIGYAQDKDSTTLKLGTGERIINNSADLESFKVEDTTHSPRLAALYSTILPGAGQFYNKKYWKIPLVYALGAFAAYQIKSNHQRYLTWRNVLFTISDLNPENNADVEEYTRIYTEESINRRVEAYERDRNYWIILSSVFYVMNIVDATVDAHLREFNINENLSMKVKPSLQSSPYQNLQAGLSVNFRIKGKNTF